MKKLSNKIKLFVVFLVSTILLTGCSYTINISPVSSTGMQIGSDFVVIVHNSSNEGKNVDITLELLNGEKVVKTLEDSIMCAPAKQDMAIVFENAIEDTKIDNYKIKLDAESSIYTDYTSNLSIEESTSNTTNKKEIVLNLENEGLEKMDTIELLIVYYKNNKPITYTWKKAESIKAGSKRSLTISKPTKDDKLIDYDEYKIYKTAYTNE